MPNIQDRQFFKQQADTNPVHLAFSGIYYILLGLTVCLGPLFSPLVQQGPFHINLNSEQDEHSFPTVIFPSSCNVSECACLFHFKLVEPPSYQAADIKISGCKQNGKSSIFAFLLPGLFSSINGNWYGQSCTTAPKKIKTSAGFSYSWAIKVELVSRLSFYWRCL